MNERSLTQVRHFSGARSANAFAILSLLLLFAPTGVCRADGLIDLPAVPDEEVVAHNVAAPSVGAVRDLKSSTAPVISMIPEKFDMAAFKAFAKKTTLVPIFEKGGPIMWPLLFASILALGTVIDRLFFLMRARRGRDKKQLTRFLAMISAGDIKGAIHAGNDSRHYVLRTLAYALEHKDKSLANALLFAQERELKRFRRGIPILDSVITLAPLLGLLGTVTGMMGSFALIGGELETPGAITGGIAEALIATAFGLGIAITSLIPFNYLNTRLEEARLEIESAATQLELMMHPRPDAVASAASVPAAPRALEWDDHAPLTVSVHG